MIEVILWVRGVREGGYDILMIKLTERDSRFKELPSLVRNKQGHNNNRSSHGLGNIRESFINYLLTKRAMIINIKEKYRLTLLNKMVNVFSFNLLLERIYISL